jgi:hypothetical protein
LSDLKVQFASDNTAGACPEAWAAMAEANADFVPSYGEDRHTLEASNLFRELFETDCDVYFVFNGTAANSLALAALCQSYHSVVCHGSAHVETDECGAPEFFSNGTKLLTAGGPHGKLDLFEVERIVTARSDVHYPKPKVISLTQATESGTVYRVDEIRALAELAQRYRRTSTWTGRFANAVASAGASPSDDGRRRRRRASAAPRTEWRGRSGRVLQPQAIGGVRVPVQAGRPARLENAVSGRPWAAMLREASGCAMRATPTRWRAGSAESCRRSRRAPAASG